jgi:hypothetical protein
MHQPLSAYEAQKYLDKISEEAHRLSHRDRILLGYYRGTEPHPGAEWVNNRISFLYDDGHDFYSAEGDGWRVALNPTMYLTGGRAWRNLPIDQHDQKTTWRNTRGVRTAGHIGSHVFFESRIEENQIHEAIPSATGFTAPRVGYTAPWASGTLDHFVATGLVGVRSRFFEVRAGRDNNRWGDARSAMMLSDYAPLYDQVQIRTTFWRIQYTNLFARFTDRTGIPPLDHNRTLPRKHGAFHQLAINLPGRVQVYFFESVLFAPDSLRGSGFDAAYLNPIIFYRAVEHDLGSPDNMMIGTGASWVVRPGVKVFGQGFLTEFRPEELFAGDGWFRNTYGVLGGIQLANLPIDGLDLRLEASKVRPYTYSHFDPSTAWVHYEDYIGHPAGQNIIDYAVFVNYRPTARWNVAVNMASTTRGRDPEGKVYGGDPRKSYMEAEHHYGVRMFHGIRVDEWLIEAHAGYELLPRLTLEGALRFERYNDAERGVTRFTEPMVQLRWGIPPASRRW